METCDICNGTGKCTVGEFDDIKEVTCVCSIPDPSDHDCHNEECRGCAKIGNAV